MNNNDNNNKSGADQETRQQVLALLNQLGDRLKRAEAEREGLREQLQEYRDQIAEIENRAATTEKVYLNIENRLNAYDRSEAELREELQEKVKKLEQVEAKIPDTDAIEKALLDKLPDIQALEKRLSGRIPDTGELEKKLSSKIPDTKQLEERAESAEKEARQAREQAESFANAAEKLERRMEQLINDNTRMSRKLERLEEDVAKTDDALKSRAMVLLTDRQAAGQSGQGYLPAGGAYTRTTSDNFTGGEDFFIRLMQRPLMCTAGVIAFVLIGVGTGWLLNSALSTGGLHGTAGAQETAQTDLGKTRRTTLAQMNMTPRKTRERATLEEGFAPLPEEAPEADSSDNGRQTDKTGKAAGHQNNGTATTQDREQAGHPDGSNAPANKTTASRQDSGADDKARSHDGAGPALRMNASTPSAGKSDRSQKQAQLPNKELPAQLGKIYKQARGAEKAAEDALMADKPETSLKQRLEPDADLPGRFKKLQEQAFKGDARAQHDLAALYTAGRKGVQQNYERAIKLFRSSARQDVANARYNLGVLYHQGVGVEPDMQKAIRYYRAASLLGHAQARYNLGIAHIQGVGTKYNPRHAAAYFEKAARGGVVEAAYNLGLIYENGLAGKANADLALFWYHHAAENGSGQAERAMDQIAGRLDLSQADIQQIIKDTDLDIEMPSSQDSARNKSASEPESPGGNMDLPGEVKPAFAPSSDPDLIAQIQRQLSRFDLYTGKADGDMGPKTSKAIKAYQEMHDLPETGKSSEDLLVHMLSRNIEDGRNTQTAN